MLHVIYVCIAACPHKHACTHMRAYTHIYMARIHTSKRTLAFTNGTPIVTQSDWESRMLSSPTAWGALSLTLLTCINSASVWLWFLPLKPYLWDLLLMVSVAASRYRSVTSSYPKTLQFTFLSDLWWMFRLFPCMGYDEKCKNMCVFLYEGSFLLSIYWE